MAIEAQVRCVGWWEQSMYGRQFMRGLWLSFSGEEVRGGGSDMIGAFTLRGRLNGSRIEMTKQYIGSHSVAYAGEFDGEGLYKGTWQIGVPGIGLDWGHWEIRITGFATGGSEQHIQTID